MANLKRTTILSFLLSAMIIGGTSCSGSKEGKGNLGNTTEQVNISESNGTTAVVGGKSSDKLTKTFSNSQLSINYPGSWVITGKGETNDWNVTTIVEISDPNSADKPYTPNLRVLTVPEKVTESTRELAEAAWYQVQSEGYQVELLDLSDGFLFGVPCAVLEYVHHADNGPMRVQQFMLKKPDNTSYSIVGQTNYDDIDEAYTIIDMIGTLKLK